MPIYDEVSTCYPYTNSVISWSVGAGKLVFLYKEEAVGGGWVAGFPTLVNYVVDPNAKTIGVSDYVEKDANSYMGQSYASMWDEFIKKSRLVKGRDTLTCDSVDVLLYQYASLKGFAAERNLTQAQIYSVLENVWKPGKFDDAVVHFAPLAKVMLAYLDRARSVDDWKGLMKQAINKNQQGLQDDPDTPHYGFIAKAGFPSEGGCMVSTPSYAAGLGLEDWIYQFWYRRSRDGNLTQTEAWLKKILKISDAVKN